MMPGEGETIEVFPPADSVVVDRHGDTDAAPTSYEVEDVLIDWDATMDTPVRGTAGARGQNVLTKVILICPEGTEVVNGAKVKLPGVAAKFTVDGDPAPWRMGSWEPGVIVRLKGVK